MSVVEEVIQARLAAVAGVTTLVPVSRIRVPGDYQNIVIPYIIHFRVATEPWHTHDGHTGTRDHDFYQVNVYAATYSAASAIEQAVITALDGHKGAGIQGIWHRGTIPQGYDPDTETHHFALNFRVVESVT